MAPELSEQGIDQIIRLFDDNGAAQSDEISAADKLERIWKVIQRFADNGCEKKKTGCILIVGPVKALDSKSFVGRLRLDEKSQSQVKSLYCDSFKEHREAEQWIRRHLVHDGGVYVDVKTGKFQAYQVVGEKNSAEHCCSGTRTKGSAGIAENNDDCLVLSVSEDSDSSEVCCFFRKEMFCLQDLQKALTDEWIDNSRRWRWWELQLCLNDEVQPVSSGLKYDLSSGSGSVISNSKSQQVSESIATKVEFDVVVDLGIFAWCPLVDWKHKEDIVADDILKCLEFEKELPEMIFNNTRSLNLQLPIQFYKTGYPTLTQTTFPYAMPHIVPLYVAEKRGLRVESVDFLIVGNCFVGLSELGNSKSKQQYFVQKMKDLIVIAKSKENPMDLHSAGFQFKRFVCGRQIWEKPSDNKYMHLRRMQVGRFSVLVSGEVDAVRKYETATDKRKNQNGTMIQPLKARACKIWDYKYELFFQMLSMGAETMIHGEFEWAWNNKGKGKSKSKGKSWKQLTEVKEITIEQLKSKYCDASSLEKGYQTIVRSLESIKSASLLEGTKYQITFNTGQSIDADSLVKLQSQSWGICFEKVVGELLLPNERVIESLFLADNIPPQIKKMIYQSAQTFKSLKDYAKNIINSTLRRRSSSVDLAETASNAGSGGSWDAQYSDDDDNDDSEIETDQCQQSEYFCVQEDELIERYSVNAGFQQSEIGTYHTNSSLGVQDLEKWQRQQIHNLQKELPNVKRVLQNKVFFYSLIADRVDASGIYDDWELKLPNELHPFLSQQTFDIEQNEHFSWPLKIEQESPVSNVQVYLPPAPPNWRSQSDLFGNSSSQTQQQSILRAQTFPQSSSGVDEKQKPKRNQWRNFRGLIQFADRHYFDSKLYDRSEAMNQWQKKFWKLAKQKKERMDEKTKPYHAVFLRLLLDVFPNFGQDVALVREEGQHWTDVNHNSRDDVNGSAKTLLNIMEGRSDLHLAVWNADVNEVRRLLDLGIQTHWKDYGNMTAVDHAEKLFLDDEKNSDKKKIYEMLSEHSIYKLGQLTRASGSALHKAVLEMKLEEVKRLLDLGVSPLWKCEGSIGVGDQIKKRFTARELAKSESNKLWKKEENQEEAWKLWEVMKAIPKLKKMKLPKKSWAFK